MAKKEGWSKSAKLFPVQSPTPGTRAIRGVGLCQRNPFWRPTDSRAVHRRGGSVPEQSIFGRMHGIGGRRIFVTFRFASPSDLSSQSRAWGSYKSAGFNISLPADISLGAGTSGVRCLQGLSLQPHKDIAGRKHFRGCVSASAAKVSRGLTTTMGHYSPLRYDPVCAPLCLPHLPVSVLLVS